VRASRFVRRVGVGMAAAAVLSAGMVLVPRETILASPPEAPILANGSAATPIKDVGRGPEDALRPSGRPYADGVVLVGFRNGATASQRAAAHRAAHATAHRAVSRLAPALERLTLEPGRSVRDAVKALQGRAGIAYAEPDYVVTFDHAPNDDLYTGGYTWGLYGLNSSPLSAYGYGIAAGDAWGQANQVGNRDVYVGIVDTGIDISHMDLKANIWTNPFETPGNGVDDDGNGYIDDVHGWDFFHDDPSVYDTVTSDFHGTHVAGTIGAVGENHEGVAGVNWAVTMIPAKFIDGEGFVSGAIAALDYLTELKTQHGLNIVATNNSWGGDAYSVALKAAINRGGDAGILFVAAAGNSALNTDTNPMYPASYLCDHRADNNQPRGYDCVISVAALTETGGLASFSNRGATSVDIGAPGVHVASTWPGGYYAYLDGTSMAAPHVTGSLALLASCTTSPTSQVLQQSLYNRGVATASLSGITSTGKRVQVGAMMADCDSGGPPRALITAAAGGTATPASFFVLFSEPVTGVEAGDFTIGGTSTGFSVSNIFTTDNSGAGYVLHLDATSPVNGTLSVTLAASSVTGVSLAGPAASQTITTIIDLTPPTVSAPVSSIRSGQSLDGAAIPTRLTWTGSDAGSGIRYYWLWYSTNGGGTWTFFDSFLEPFVDLLITPSGSLRFRVQALDWAGWGSGLGTGPTFSPRLSQESSTAIKYSVPWSLSKYASYSGGAVRYTSVGKRYATYTISARSIGFVTTLAASRGVVKIFLDGAQVARIDLGKTPTAFRRIVWSKTFSSAGAHKVKVVVVGGYGRVDLDAFAVLR
jgi:hypothetical protein